MDRETIFRRLNEDLIGPLEAHECLVGTRPTDVYLTGILWPSHSQMGAEEDDHLSSTGAGSAADDQDATGGEVSAVNQMKPSTAGVSFAVTSDVNGAPEIHVQVKFALYNENRERDDGKVIWERRPHQVRIGPIQCSSDEFEVALNKDSHLITVEQGDPKGLRDGVRIHVRSVRRADERLVTVTLVNGAVIAHGEGRGNAEMATLFQTALIVEPRVGTRLVARPSRRTVVDAEDAALDLLYRNAREFAVGHTCSASWEDPEGGSHAKWVSTTWVPSSVVPVISSKGHQVFRGLEVKYRSPMSPKWIIEASPDELIRGLSEFVEAYDSWIVERDIEANALPSKFHQPARENLDECRKAMKRMRAGIRLLESDSCVRDAFLLANQAMLIQFDWSAREDQQGTFAWRPFQLGFILLSLKSLTASGDEERAVMDLLWFPTGGGKTEAYLALVAYTAFYRRLRNGETSSAAGVSSIMRYTLRLLTTQQFTRAARMIMACEAIRRQRVGAIPNGCVLGKTPFSVGLWAGGDATPNSYREAKRALKGDNSISSPKQLTTCPACKVRLQWRADDDTETIHVECPNEDCVLHDETASLPVWTVDDDVFRNRPTLLVGTVDKFAQIVRKKEVCGLFGVNSGRPPDLVIQDELHLISGPLGTMAGLYEAAIDRLFSSGEHTPKVIGSTATIRKASDQVRALFDRQLAQFPPPGLDAKDSGFATEEPIGPSTPGRLYLGVTTAGRSAKFTLQAVSASLLQSASQLDSRERQDPYSTLVAYFNSLRELGGALVLMQDDVNDSIGNYAARRGEDPRPLGSPEELTSRRTQAEIRDMLDTLAIPAGEVGTVDTVLATNMVSVGVDIPRLGLMVVNGQPKMISEYIQATSRVGRGSVAGLIVDVLNNAKARDRSHFETFTTWHGTLYRDVEATSVTPFASRARDRALHAVVVALIRHLVPGMLDAPRIEDADQDAIEGIVRYVTNRAFSIDSSENDVEREVRDLVEEWKARSPQHYWNDRAVNKSLLQSAERAAAKRAVGRRQGAAWSTPNSMRNVEPETPFRLVGGLKVESSDRGGQDG